MGLVRIFNTQTFKMKTIFVIAILFSISSLVLGCCKSSGECCKKCNQTFKSNRNGLLDRGVTNNEAIESMAFEVCDMDSDSGLTWEEVEACEGKYCPLLPFTCPDKTDFGSYDVDANGILTWGEWKSQAE